MIKRIIAFLLVLPLLWSFPMTAYACDEEQTNVYVLQILFGEDILRYENDEDVETLLNALYICSEQSNREGQEKLDQLKKAKVGSVPTLAKVNVSGEFLFDCSHNSWEYESKGTKKEQEERKALLRKAVINVFDFGWANELFNRNSGKIDSFAALLYYSHLLADYLADDPMDTEISVSGYDIPAYSGSAYKELNGNIPLFSNKQKKETESFKEYSDLDGYGRCGAGIANIGPDTLANISSRDSSAISNVKPTGWNQESYKGVMAAELYNRCHLIAHQLGGTDTRWNLVTGTRYLNEAMIPFEDKVANYIRETGNHVLYRATPVYVGDNAVASGVQLEAYSVEDKGQGICFNVYLYNVQPGIDINYANGNSELADQTLTAEDILPFATLNAGENNPDLMYEIEKHLEILFSGQKDTGDFESMINDLEQIADSARSIGDGKDWKVYSELKQYQYDYVEKLSEYVPKLLEQETFFQSVFQ